MQTFLPYADFSESARVLDNRRLGKQRVEALQILDTLIVKRDAWSNHPAVRMWRGYEPALFDYTLSILNEWEHRGYHNTRCDLYFEDLAISYNNLYNNFDVVTNPLWLGNEAFHSAHRAILLAKNPAWYSRFGWSEKPAIKESSGKWPYVWPV